MRILLACALLLAAPLAKADEQYDQHYIGFDDFAFADPDTGLVQRLTLPYEGKYKVPLEGAAFYRKVGREDLAHEYELRSRRRIGMMVLGGLVVAGGAIGSIAVASQSGPDCALGSAGFGQCVVDSGNAGRARISEAAAIGIGAGLAGGALLLAGALLDPNPVSAPEMRRLADLYNQKLKLAPVVSTSTAGLAMNLRF